MDRVIIERSRRNSFDDVEESKMQRLILDDEEEFVKNRQNGGEMEGNKTYILRVLHPANTYKINILRKYCWP